ncbi:MAG TPA: hypothetical protein VKV95_17970 [Terriglobia bacterium]|nr:hypothetical protein [Terriglobia bacterium]
MRRTRFMSLLFLVWSIAFFFVADFRQALEAPVLAFGYASSASWFWRVGTVPQRSLDEAVKSARPQRAARTLAFAAMHSSQVGREQADLAAQAVTIDPDLTWIYLRVFNRWKYQGGTNSDIKPLLSRLEGWDPDNAYPYLIEGEEIIEQLGPEIRYSTNLDALAQQTEWRRVMDKAFTAPHYDSYALREFDLDRTWLTSHDLAKPQIVLLMVASYPLPNLLNIRRYSLLLIKKLGKEAEAAGHESEALGYYWKVAHMGERMRLNDPSLICRLIGVALEKDAYEKLIPILRRNGQTDQAATIEATLNQTHLSIEEEVGRDPMAQSANAYWASVTVAMFAMFVMAFGLLTGLSVIYVNAKRWVRVEKKGRIFRFVTVAENYLPIVLFLACLGLYLSYYPYAINFHHYMTATAPIHDLEPIFSNIIPLLGLEAGEKALQAGNPFVPYFWYALLGLAALIVLAVITSLQPAGERGPKSGN